MSGHDPFRPHGLAAGRIYDALAAEAKLRKGRSLDEWLTAERNAVWAAARDLAQQQGSPVPTLAQVEQKERLAVGHSDFGSKWAIGVAELLRPVTA